MFILMVVQNLYYLPNKLNNLLLKEVMFYGQSVELFCCQIKYKIWKPAPKIWSNLYSTIYNR